MPQAAPKIDVHSLPKLKTLPREAPYKKGDVLVVFGELFARGYANGIVDEAERHGMTVVRSTVGRREPNGTLRALTSEEASAVKAPFINVPLEAGFDLEPASEGGPTPNSFFEGVKLSEWEKAKCDWGAIERSRALGRKRFQENVRRYVAELTKVIPDGANVIFCHTMAGGVPRTKIIMPVMNRVFKGTGDRHVPSQALFDSDLGKFALMNFDEVTAETLQILIEETSNLRRAIEDKGGHASYLAYGYHGTEVLVGEKFRWQTYSPYFQGWAKMKLENVARDHHAKGVRVTVHNCPEILTNSSSIFLGVEVSLYPLLGALKAQAEKGSAKAKTIVDSCRALLKPEATVESIMRFTKEYIESDLIERHSDFSKWPQNNSREQMEKMLAASDTLFGLHLDSKNAITSVLSEHVFRSTGYLMLHDSWECAEPVRWLGHDVLSLALASGKTL